MNAEIITIGDEILIGQILDSNSQWIAQQLNILGISVYQITSIQDDAFHITRALKEACKYSDIVIITGGLGPTKDDITKTTLTQFFDDKLVLNQEVADHIKGIFTKMNFRFVDSDLQQAMLPSKAQLIHNEIGTASGMWFNENNKIVVSLPGVPAEMKALMSKGILSKLQKTFKLPFIIHRTLITYGVRESEMAIRLERFEEELPKAIKLAYLPNYRRLRLRLTAKGNDQFFLENQIQQEVDTLESLLDDVVIGHEAFLLEVEIGNLLSEREQTVATAESCTGGNIAHLITSIPGASNYFVGSVVSYTAKVKVDELNVSENLIEKHTVVSAEVAEAMAVGVQKKLHTDYAIATTGNAGPTTDKTDKSVGDVYIAIATPKGVSSYFFNFGQPREKVIHRASSKALELLQKEIKKYTKK
jgi:nicotinamide-nucleotide amidase